MLNFKYTEKLAEKQRKPVKVGECVFKSLAEASRKLRISVSTIRSMAKEGKYMPNGDRVEMVVKPYETSLPPL